MESLLGRERAEDIDDHGCFATVDTKEGMLLNALILNYLTKMMDVELRVNGHDLV